MVIGVLSLIPSYVISGTKEKEALKNVEALEKSRQARGLDQIEKDLIETQALTKILTIDKTNPVFSDIIQLVTKPRPPGITIFSFDVSSIATKSTTSVSIIIQGKASTRDVLIDFKQKLEKNKDFSSIELPISDLAKGKNISFALRFTKSL